LRIPLLDGHAETERREVVRNGVSDRLTEKEAELLAFLAGRPGAGVTRETLLAEVWRYHPDAKTRTLDTTVRRLRAKIEPVPHRPQLLLTVHHVGYRFVPPPEVAVAEETPVVRVAPRAHVPTDPTRLVGREAEIASVGQLLDRGGRAVIVGIGGVGKSRVARAAAHTWSARHGAPAWWVPATGLADGDELARQIARVLTLRLPSGGHGGPPHEALDAVGARLGRMAPVLVVLDGADDLDEAIVEQVLGWSAAVGPASPPAVLLTRRSRPGNAPALRLHPLPPDAAAELFTEQVRSRQPGLAVDGDAVRRVVALLDGLPLAVQLAAARTRVLGLPELQRRLARGLDVLEDRADPGEHGALDRVLHRSWDLLDPDARRALLRCTAFSGRFSLDLARAVLGDGADESLEALVDAAWIESVEQDGELAFVLLDCVRVFVAPRWDQADRDATLARFASGLGEAARERLDPLFGPRDADASSWLRRHASDLDRVPASADLLLARGFAALAIGDEARAQSLWEELGGEIGALHRARSTLLPPEARRELLQSVAASADGRLRAAASLERGRVDNHAGAESASHFRAAVEAFEALGDPVGTAEACFQLAYQHAEVGDWDNAGKTRRRGLDAVSGRGTLVEAELLIAPYPLPAAEEPTIEQLESAAALAFRAGDRRLVARSAVLIAFAALQQARLDRALQAARDAVEAVSGTSSPTLRAGVLGNAGIVLRELAWFDEAEACFRTVEAELGETRHPHLRLGVLINRAWSALDRGRLDVAEAVIAKAAPLADDPVSLARVEVLWAVLLALRGDPAEATLRAAHAVLVQHEAPTHLGRVALLLAALGAPDADALLAEAMDVGDRYGEVALFEAAQELWVRRGRPPRSTPPQGRPDAAAWLGLVRLVRRLSHRVTSAPG
jgi:DNA-binding winged helix-turn-helix (wHTH) protein/tetratricopeptide (TPR) repeat protein